MEELSGPSYLLLALTIIALVQSGLIGWLWKRANDQDKINGMMYNSFSKHKEKAQRMIDEWET